MLVHQLVVMSSCTEVHAGDAIGSALFGTDCQINTRDMIFKDDQGI